MVPGPVTLFATLNSCGESPTHITSSKSIQVSKIGSVFLSTLPPVASGATLIVIMFDDIASQGFPKSVLVDFLLKKVVSRRIVEDIFLVVAPIMSSHVPPLTLFCH